MGILTQKLPFIVCLDTYLLQKFEKKVPRIAPIRLVIFFTLPLQLEWEKRQRSIGTIYQDWLLKVLRASA